jgi:hypothetical protein
MTTFGLLQGTASGLALLSLFGLLSIVALFAKYRLLGYMLALPLLAALWLSGSRAGWLALPIVMLCLALHLRVAAHHGDETHKRLEIPGGNRVLAIGIGVTVFAIVAIGLAVLATGEGVRVTAITQRVDLWRDVLVLIAQSPWLGIGFNQLNFAWTLTPLPQRSGDVFDHAHNLPLHVAAELGIPGTLLLSSLLLGALLLAALRSTASWRWIAIGIVGVSLWQSLFEYPMWFAHFLLPVAAIGALVANTSRADTQQKPVARSVPTLRWTRAAAVSVGLVAFAFAIWIAQGYRAVAHIYANAHDLPKAQAAADRARSHYVFGYYGDYASIMLSQDGASLELFDRPTRGVIDEKLLTAWARALDRAGLHDEAAHLVARAREFKFDASFERLPPIVVDTLSAPRISIERFRNSQNQ